MDHFMCIRCTGRVYLEDIIVVRYNNKIYYNKNHFFFLVDTICDYVFSEYPPNGAKFEETVQYECPVFLSKFCHREVEFQRRAIATNLKEEF